MKLERLRVLTLNIHKGLSYFNRRMVIHELREGLQTLDPDLVFLQEVQGLNQRFALRFAGCPVEPQHAFLAGDTWQHVYGCNAVYDHGHHGNAILSRYGFLSYENQDVSDHGFERRGLLHSVVAVPGWRRNLRCAMNSCCCQRDSRRRRTRSYPCALASGTCEAISSRCSHGALISTRSIRLSAAWRSSSSHVRHGTARPEDGSRHDPQREHRVQPSRALRRSSAC